MKKLILFISAAMVSAASFGQADIRTKQYVISDFKEKTLNVVLSGNGMEDAFLRDELQSVWNISAYEFCTREEFEQRKKSEDWYFLAIAESTYKGEAEAGIKSICIYKGSAKASKNFEGMYKVVSIPYCTAKDSDGSETAFLAPLLTILQKEVTNIMSRPLNLGNEVIVGMNKSFSKWKKKLVIDENFLKEKMSPSLQATYKEEGLVINGENDSSQLLADHDPESLVGYVAAPVNAFKGDVCYTMVIDAGTWDICYIKKSRLGTGEKGGFSQSELKSMLKRISIE